MYSAVNQQKVGVVIVGYKTVVAIDVVIFLFPSLIHLFYSVLSLTSAFSFRYLACEFNVRTCKRESLSVPHSIAHLTHASSCGVATRTIRSSARPRKDRPSMEPCVEMGRYLYATALAAIKDE